LGKKLPEKSLQSSFTASVKPQPENRLEKAIWKNPKDSFGFRFFRHEALQA
jgi:hypothetical protein